MTGASGVEALPPPSPPAHQQRAYLVRIGVASALPAVRHPARVRRVAVACRRHSTLDVRRTSRMLRVSVPVVSLGTATLAQPPAWMLTLTGAPAIPITEQAPAPAEADADLRGAEVTGHPLPATPAPAAAPEAAEPGEPAPGEPAPTEPRSADTATQVSATPTAAATLALPAVATPTTAPLPSAAAAPWRVATGHIANLALAAALGLVGIFCAIVVGLVVTGHHLEQVVTGSMTPTIPVGSLVVTQSVPVSQLQVGDVMVFPNPYDSSETIIHRIVWLSHNQQGDVLVKTKGDANSLPDNWEISRSENAEADQVIWIMPGVGTAAAWLQKVGVWGLIALLIGVIGWYGLRKVRSILAEDDGPHPTEGVSG